MSPWRGPVCIARDLGENKYVIVDDESASAIGEAAKPVEGGANIPREPNEIERPVLAEIIIQETAETNDDPSNSHHRSAAKKITNIQVISQPEIIHIERDMESQIQESLDQT